VIGTKARHHWGSCGGACFGCVEMDAEERAATSWRFEAPAGLFKSETLRAELLRAASRPGLFLSIPIPPAPPPTLRERLVARINRIRVRLARWIGGDALSLLEDDDY
jgi:hypothetical protein